MKVPSTVLGYCFLLSTSRCLFINGILIRSLHHHIRSTAVPSSASYSFSSPRMSQWDAENGVWVGEKAISADKLPSPLYLFGYGSLLWRPGDLLENFPSYSCECSGWQRLFAQRSCDHRGSPEFPGFVATLVAQSYLESAGSGSSVSVTATASATAVLSGVSASCSSVSLSNVTVSSSITSTIDPSSPQNQSITDRDISSSSSNSNGRLIPHSSASSSASSSSSDVICSGLVWFIPDERVKVTIEELDYRERGGYHRHVINVTLTEATAHHREGDVIQALVYSGSTSNPNFHYMPNDEHVPTDHYLQSDQYVPDDAYVPSDQYVPDDDVSLTQLSIDTPIRPSMSPLSNAVSIESPITSDSVKTENRMEGRFFPRSATADVIAAAVGPSGANSEYLFKLNDFLLSNGLEDPYIRGLADDVARRMGPWRVNRVREYCEKRKIKEGQELRGLQQQQRNVITDSMTNDSMDDEDMFNDSVNDSMNDDSEYNRSLMNIIAEDINTEIESRKNSAETREKENVKKVKKEERESNRGTMESILDDFLDAKVILGWGSNEYVQIGTYTQLTHVERDLQSIGRNLELKQVKEEMRGNAGERRNIKSPPITPSGNGDRCNNGNSGNTDYLDSLQYSQILCGGAYSGLLGPTGTLSLWGKPVDRMIEKMGMKGGKGEMKNGGNDVDNDDHKKNKSKSNDHTVDEKNNGNDIHSLNHIENNKNDIKNNCDNSDGNNNDITVINYVIGAALGYEHMLLLTASGGVLALGDNQWGQCSGPSSFVSTGCTGVRSRLLLDDNNCIPENILAMNVPENITENVLENSPENVPENVPRVAVLKLAAGVRHSAAITREGVLHVWGAGSAGKINPPSPISSSSSSSSSSVSATTTVATPASAASPTSASATSTVTIEASITIHTTQPIDQKIIEPSVSPSENTWSTPDGAQLIDVSCGLHHTVVVDERGRVWSFGDDRFGSLGRVVPSIPSSSSIASPVPTSSDADVNSDSAINQSTPSTISSTITSKNGENGVKGKKGGDRAVQSKVDRERERERERDSTPRQVQGLEQGVRWQRVCCGWSHTVVRGVRPDGTIATAAWGRRNLGQYPESEVALSVGGDELLHGDKPTLNEDTEDTKETQEGKEIMGIKEKKEEEEDDEVKITPKETPRITPKKAPSPQKLTLPNGCPLREVWAGSEYTIVADNEGYLWGSGWNEHGNLARGPGSEFVSSDGWVKVMRSANKERGDVKGGVSTDNGLEHVRLSVVWEGALACGGGHVLCLTEF